MILCFHQYGRVHEQTKRKASKIKKKMVKEEPFIFFYFGLNK